MSFIEKCVQLLHKLLKLCPRSCYLSHFFIQYLYISKSFSSLV